jgi:hypothetical protein
MIPCGQAMAGVLADDTAYLGQLAQLALFGRVINVRRMTWADA